MFYSPHFHFVAKLMCIIDVYTNVYSVMLSFNYFDPLYIRICGKCHKSCDKCWRVCSDRNNMIQKDEDTLNATVGKAQVIEISIDQTCEV